MCTGHRIRLAIPGDAQALGTIKVAALRLTYQGIIPDAIRAAAYHRLAVTLFSLRKADRAPTVLPLGKPGKHVLNN